MENTTLVTIGGKQLWRRVIRGRRGGRQVIWCARVGTMTEPSPWQFWSDRAKDAMMDEPVVSYNAL